LQSRRVLRGELKEIKQSLILEKVFPTAEIPKKVDKSLEEYKRVEYNKFFEVLPSMKDNQHHGMIILHNFEDPFLQAEFVQDYIIHHFLDWNS